MSASLSPESASPRGCVDRLLRMGAISTEKHRRLLLAVRDNEGLPRPEPTRFQRVLKALTRHGEPLLHDRLGVRYLAGEIEEDAFRTGAMRESIKAACLLGVFFLAVSGFMHALGLKLSSTLSKLELPILLEMVSFAIGVSFFWGVFLHWVSTGVWHRLKATLEDSPVQRDPREDV